MLGFGRKRKTFGEIVQSVTEMVIDLNLLIGENDDRIEEIVMDRQALKAEQTSLVEASNKAEAVAEKLNDLVTA